MMITSIGKMAVATSIPASRLVSTEAVRESVTLGKRFVQDRCFNAPDVEAYTQLTGDTNPIHSSASAARDAGFGACVVPGMLCASLFPAIIGSRFKGAIYVTQDLRFKVPLLVGESIRAEVEVCSILKLRQHAKVTFYTRCLRGIKEDKAVLIDGQAIALLPPSAIGN